MIQGRPGNNMSCWEEMVKKGGTLQHIPLSQPELGNSCALLVPLQLKKNDNVMERKKDDRTICLSFDYRIDN
jgi:hypothetical protein